ncbi:sigma-54-dependent transcriptional regulator [Pseudarcicella hirudinis]|uniref:sigma-54-dependent transcriptional regulator n=1 Tax=Pseudarcicella hirudinis TaxID=1079859 RepID=UPI0035EEFCDB
MAILDEFRPNLVITDFKLGDIDGGQLLVNIKEKYPHMPVLIITGYSDIKVAVNVMKQGAFDYVTKPLFPDEILVTIRKALDSTSTGFGRVVSSEKEDNPETDLPKSGRPAKGSGYVFGNSPESKNLIKQIELVAPTNYSVIIYGESGSGKEVIAHEIHKRSRRKDQPFVAMDCGAISRELAGSELFGHEKGSFTGALNQKIGHFELANGGTLFLDEVANLSYEIQVSLLRIVQERIMKRIGGTKEIQLDVRIIVASNEKLTEACRKGKFREDLYHRFNEFSIDVPSLRERKGDIMTFARFFLESAKADLGKEMEGFEPAVEETFLHYPWHGNLRELKNVIKRAALLSEGKLIEARSLPFEMLNYSKLLSIENNPQTINIISPEVQPQNQPFIPPAAQNTKGNQQDLKAAALDAEYDMILKVLQQVNFNKSKAAEILNIDRKTLYNKMKHFSK